jgi:hypothetical protein
MNRPASSRTWALDHKEGFGSAIDIFHYYTHAGKAYSSDYLFEGVGDGTYADIYVGIASGVETHMTFSVASEGKAYIYTLEGVTATTNAANIIPSLNHYREKNDSSDVSVYFSPVISNTGTTLGVQLLVGGEGPRSVGGAAGERSEYIFESSESPVAIRVLNKGAAAKDISIDVSWYERPE